MKRTYVWLTVVAALSLVCAAGAEEPDLLQGDSRDNAKWAVDGASASITRESDSTPELEMNFAPFRKGPVSFTFTTDASYVRVKPGYTSIKLALTGKRHTLVLSAAEGEPQLVYNGKADKALQAEWASAVAKMRKDELTLRFGRCESVKLRWQRGVAEHAADAEHVDSLDPDAPAGPLSADAALARLRRATVQLELQRDADWHRSLATAVLVGEKGLAVTHAHLLRGVTGGRVQIPGARAPVGVELVMVDTDADLALVRLDLSHAPTAALVEPLALAGAELAEKAVLWVGAVSGGRYDIAKAEVDKVVGYTELDARLRAVLEHRAGSRWLLLEEPLGPRHAGMPVLNEHGELVGFGTFALAARSRDGRVVSTAKLAELIGRQPLEPITFAGAQRKLAEGELPLTTYPRLRVEAAQTAQQLRRQGTQLHQTHECAACKGDPVITRRVKVGYRKSGNVREPVFEDREFACRVCDGTGLNDGESLWRSVANFTTVLAQTSKGDPAMGEVSRYVRENLRAMAEKHTVALTGLLAEHSKPALVGGPEMIGKPVVLIGTLRRGVEVPGGAGAVIGIGLDRDRVSGGYFLLDGVRLEGSARAKVALAGGVIAGFVQEGDGMAAMPIVTGGFVVPLANPQDEDDVRKPQPPSKRGSTTRRGS